MGDGETCDRQILPFSPSGTKKAVRQKEVAPPHRNTDWKRLPQVRHTLSGSRAYHSKATVTAASFKRHFCPAGTDRHSISYGIHAHSQRRNHIKEISTMKSLFVAGIVAVLMSAVPALSLAQQDTKHPHAKKHHHHRYHRPSTAGGHVNQFSKNVNHEANRESKDVNHFANRGSKGVNRSVNKASIKINHSVHHASKDVGTTMNKASIKVNHSLNAFSKGVNHHLKPRHHDH
jgi:hypothetical protein